MERFLRLSDFLGWRASIPERERVGFVPTMGFLHLGHTSLMELARTRCDRLVVSNFVNPLQFGPAEDLSRYPRDPEGDAQKCQEHGVDAILEAPDLYPPGFQTRVAVSGLTSHLCGASRPGHFEGVTTVVARLLGLVRPAFAVFGEKDYQQLLVVRQMTRDLALNVEILPGALVRDTDGLALSSRNRFLSPDDRARACSLSRALFRMRDSHLTIVDALLALGRGLLQVDSLDYLSVVDAETLQALDQVDRPCRAMVAARLGSTRLIDNVPLDPETPNVQR